MQYQVIILAFRYLLASFGRGAAARPRWFYSELVYPLFIPFWCAFTPFTPEAGAYTLYPLLLDIPPLPRVPLRP